ncbi:NucA/NucB deoxyribonuclease domain-containing protein [Frigoribacterium sp. SL97]|uniref:NucA/NucB deoxyribonuclease domain-containing protein n=1 Tax=Frigoribacterium sp. SL97 TaxID=2994664 RepID=UPI002271738F|nr:hypothetical protein [Frigoribacterium sp. SL97]WAC50303.1 hypothetical protein OVA02_10410 [Frigoribacterium sp. SL97]
MHGKLANVGLMKTTWGSVRTTVAATAATALAAGFILAGAGAAQAAGPYDAVTSSSLRNFASAVEYVAMFGSGNYDDTEAADLSDWGWSEGGNPNTEVEMWVEGSGGSWKATARDVRGGAEYSYSSNSVFNGGSAASVHVSAQQPTDPVGPAGLTVHHLSDGVDAEALAAALAGVAPSAICDGLLFVKGTHQSGSSVSDQYLACSQTARVTGATARSVLLAVRSAGGDAALSAVGLYYVGAGTAPAAAPAWTQQVNPAPPSGPTLPSRLPDFWRVGAVASALLSTNPALSPSYAETVATQCLARMAAAGLDAYSDCKSDRMFVVGQDGTTDEATDHDADAITSYPAWVQLDYRPAAENTSPRGWYASQPECSSITGQQCDEFPFFASAQGGRDASPRPSLRMINAAHNQQEGYNYNSFLATCGLYAAPANDRQYLVVPMPSGSGVPTLNICNGN